MILRVIGHHTDRGGTYPVFEILDWSGNDIPAENDLKHLEIRHSNRQGYKHIITQLILVGIGKRAYSSGRIESIGIRLKPVQKSGRSSVRHWKYFDKFLKEWFLLE